MTPGAFAVILQQLNCSLGYVYEIMGVLIGSAVAPIAMCLCWKKTNKWGAIAGAFLGQWLGLASWAIFAKVITLANAALIDGKQGSNRLTDRLSLHGP